MMDEEEVFQEVKESSKKDIDASEDEPLKGMDHTLNGEEVAMV